MDELLRCSCPTLLFLLLGLSIQCQSLIASNMRQKLQSGNSLSLSDLVMIQVSPAPIGDP
jgi:hypothetical protein